MANGPYVISIRHTVGGLWQYPASPYCQSDHVYAGKNVKGDVF